MSLLPDSDFSFDDLSDYHQILKYYHHNLPGKVPLDPLIADIFETLIISLSTDGVGFNGWNDDQTISFGSKENIALTFILIDISDEKSSVNIRCLLD